MTREAALLDLRRLACGLEPDVNGCARLLERVSQASEAEALRDALAELGAQALLRERANGSAA